MLKRLNVIFDFISKKYQNSKKIIRKEITTNKKAQNRQGFN